MCVASQGYDTVYYIKSPQQSLCVTSELTTNGWFSWFLLGSIASLGSL